MAQAIDIIIVADSTRYIHRAMTENAIAGCKKSDVMKFNFIVVDGNLQTRGFDWAKTITYDFEFNYNKCLNLGLKYCKNNYIALCNNDLIFHQFWASRLLKVMDEGIMSASPNDQWSGMEGYEIGYEVGRQVKGWCIVIDRRVMDIIGGLAMPCNFWYSDNVYAEQIKKHGITHALVYNSFVMHIGSKTLRSQVYKRKFTLDQKKIFDNWLKEYENTGS